MYSYKVKFNANEIVVNDNSQSMFKSKHHIKKNYFRKIKDNSSEIIMIASDFSNCFEKAKKQQAKFDTIDKTEMNTDGDDENSEWDNTLLDGLDNM